MFRHRCMVLMGECDGIWSKTDWKYHAVTSEQDVLVGNTVNLPQICAAGEVCRDGFL